MTASIDETRHGFVFGLAGYSGAGKTTLAEKLISALAGRGHRIASIKHAHHDFDPDTPGKDSWRHRRAGTAQMLISSARRRVLFTDIPESGGNGEADLATLLAELAPADFVLVEGFKETDFPKLEVWRKDANHPFIHTEFPGIKMIASDVDIPDCPLPRLDINDTDGIADAIERGLLP